MYLPAEDYEVIMLYRFYHEWLDSSDLIVNVKRKSIQNSDCVPLQGLQVWPVLSAIFNSPYGPPL